MRDASIPSKIAEDIISVQPMASGLGKLFSLRGDCEPLSNRQKDIRQLDLMLNSILPSRKWESPNPFVCQMTKEVVLLGLLDIDHFAKKCGLSDELHSQVEKFLESLGDDELWVYDDITFLCGHKGYAIVEKGTKNILREFITHRS